MQIVTNKLDQLNEIKVSDDLGCLKLLDNDPNKNIFNLIRNGKQLNGRYNFVKETFKIIGKLESFDKKGISILPNKNIIDRIIFDKVNYRDDIDMNKGSELPLDYLFGSSKDATITAQWKDVEPDPTIEYSTPESINVNYDETRTAFDVQVTDASFTQGETRYDIRLCDSTFTCSENGGSIPFTMNGEITRQNWLSVIFILMLSQI
jgi:hypothetical protein